MIPACPPAGLVVLGIEVSACCTNKTAAAPGSSRSRSRRRCHDHRTTDPLVLPPLLAVASVTTRFAFARARLDQGAWEPAYKLSSGRSWWRCLRLAAKGGQLHPCAERLAKHLSWQLSEQVTLTNIRTLLAGYAAYHSLSLRTAWTDWGRLVQAGWLSPTRAPANQGRSRPQGPGSGRSARYVLTAPATLMAKLRSRSCRRSVTALDSFSLKEAFPLPSVPPPQQDQQRGWVTLRLPTMTERQNAPRCWPAATNPGDTNAPTATCSPAQTGNDCCPKSWFHKD